MNPAEVAPPAESGDSDKRIQFETGLAAGKSVKELAIELGIPKSTAYQWRATQRDQHAENENPDPAAPPEIIKPARARGKMAVRPITEETAGQLCSGMFFVACALSNEKEWLLSDAERASLAGPFADSLRVIPSPIARAVNTYSAPAVFITALSAVVMAKKNRIQFKRDNPHLFQHGDPRMVRAPERAAVPPAGAIVATPPALEAAEGTAALEPGVAEAFAAARSQLTAYDEDSSGERAFT